MRDIELTNVLTIKLETVVNGEVRKSIHLI
jgi:hypothetical protein